MYKFQWTQLNLPIRTFGEIYSLYHMFLIPTLRIQSPVYFMLGQHGISITSSTSWATLAGGSKNRRATPSKQQTKTGKEKGCLM